MFDSQSNKPDAHSALLLKLQSKLNVWFWTVNMSTMQCELSEQLENICGFKDRVVTFEAFLGYVHPDNRDEVWLRASKHFIDGKLSFPIMTVEGYRWIDSDIIDRIVNDAGEEIVYGFFTFPNHINKEDIDGNSAWQPRLFDLTTNMDSISESLHRLLSTGDTSSGIHDLLEALLDQFNGDRTYIIAYNQTKQTQSCVHEVVRDNVASESELLQDVDVNYTKWWTQNMFAMKPIVINHIDELPPEAQAEWSILHAQDIKSLIVAPLSSRGKVWGYIGIDIVGNARSWSDDDRRWFLALSYLIGICLSLKRTEDVAQLEKAQFNDLNENMPLGFIRVKMVYNDAGEPLDFIFQDVNSAFCNIANVSYSELIGSYASQTCPDLHETYLLIIDDVAQDNGVDLRNYTLYKDGKYYETTMYITSNREVVSLFYDNTEVIETSNMLRSKEETLRSIYDNIPVGIEIYDKTGILIDVNDMELEIFGASQKSDVLGVNLFENPNIRQDYKDLLRNKQPVELVLNYDFGEVSSSNYYESQHKNMVKSIRGLGNVILDANGDIENYIFITIDTTDSLRVTHELYEFELLFNSISEFSAIGLCRWKPNGKTLVATDQWYDNLCQEPRPIVDIREAYSNVHPEDFGKLNKALEAMTAGEMDIYSDQFRINDGKGWKWLKSYFKRMPIDENNCIIIGLNIDISETKKVEMELIEARKKAEQADNLKSAFIANMSHEIRTPLNAIVGFSDLLISTECDDEEKDQYISIIRSNNDLLLQLISDILDMSKMESGIMDISKDEVYIGLICDEVVNSHRFKVSDNVKLIYDTPDKECRVYTDKNRVSQVLINFINNAIKFTSQGEIRVGYEIIDGFVRFYVKDTGVGIAEDQLENVFNRFVKLDSFVSGSGLGLAICKTIVERLGGEIWVESEISKGSSFFFTIPCESKSMNKTGLNDVLAEQDTVKHDNGDSKPLVLIAEDTDSNYLLVSTILKNNYRLMRAVNGVEAVDLCERYKPDMILMDIRMPEMDGLEATGIIRAQGHTMPIIALTAFAFDSDKDKAVAAGCNEFVSKPINPTDLKNIIAQYIG